MNKELVLILDFGGSLNQLIARRVRELSVYCEMVPGHISLAEIKSKNPRAIIFSGGPAGKAGDRPVCDPGIFTLGIPILADGYGMELIAGHFAPTVELGEVQNGWGKITVIGEDLLFTGLAGEIEVNISGAAPLKDVPQGFQALALNGEKQIAAIGHLSQKIYGVQFSPEARGSAAGRQILENFLFKIASLQGDWDLDTFIEEMVTDIKNQVGDQKILCALSGGVDSSVAATLVHRAVGGQLVSVFVDTGLMRKGEPEEVVKVFRDQLKMNLVFVEAKDRFLSKLAGVNDPEQKRKVIGTEFIRIFEEEAQRMGDIKFLVQGTIYPDIIESGTKTSGAVKSHHNVGGLPEDMEFTLVEPLRLLFKDEVRLIGEKLGIAKELVWRQPFPGPGLGVRVLEEVTAEKLDILREADYIFREEIRNAGLEREIWQSFVVLPPVKTVGVKNGARTYAYPVIIRAVNSEDAMTAEVVKLPLEFLEKVALRIINEVAGVNRVAYDITPKPPGTVEWE